MKKLLVAGFLVAGGFLIKIAAFGVGGVLGHAAVSSYTESQRYQQIDAELAKSMNSINKQAPLMVDKETRLDNVVGLNHQLQYNYTLINYDAGDVPADKLATVLRPVLYNDVCKGKTMQVFRENGVPVSYSYKGKDGVDIIRITISPEDCKASAS